MDVRFAAVLLVLATAGCTTLGTNIKGSFACRAPAGTCAPIAVSDREAIARSGGRAVGEAPASMMGNDLGAAIRPVADFDTSRTGEHVLKVVFPAHVDSRGVYHDEAAVHAVVDRAEWREALRTADTSERDASPRAIAARARSLDDVVAAAPNALDDAADGSGGPTELQALVAASEAAPVEHLDTGQAEAVMSAERPSRVAIDYPSAEAIARARAGGRIGDGRGPATTASVAVSRPAEPPMPAPPHVPGGAAGASTAELNHAASEASTGDRIRQGSVAAPSAASPAPAAPATPAPPTSDPALAMARVKEAIGSVMTTAKPAELPSTVTRLRSVPAPAIPAGGAQ